MSSGRRSLPGEGDEVPRICLETPKIFQAPSVPEAKAEGAAPRGAHVVQLFTFPLLCYFFLPRLDPIPSGGSSLRFLAASAR
jgi:hypothetical protein